MKKFLSLIALLALTIIGSANDTENQVVLEVVKKYPASDKSILDLDISFAQLKIKYDQVNEITVKMSAASVPEVANCKQEILDHFGGATRANANGVQVKINGVFEHCKERKSCNVKVEVEITMPLKASTEGSTSFTNVKLYSTQGRVKLHSDYGNLDAEGLWAYDNEVKVEFGNVKIMGTNGGRFELQYGNLEVDNLQGSAIVDVEFGNIELQRVQAQSTHLNVKAAYGNIDMTLEASANYAFEVQSSYGNVSLDKALKVAYSEKDYTEVIKKGSLGNGSGKLYAQADFGNIQIHVQ